MDIIEINEIPDNSKEERIRAIVTIVVTAAVNIVNLWGYAIDLDGAITAALTILSVISWFWCWWKNQNVTREASKAQFVLNALKEADRVAIEGDGGTE